MTLCVLVLVISLWKKCAGQVKLNCNIICKCKIICKSASFIHVSIIVTVMDKQFCHVEETFITYQKLQYFTQIKLDIYT